MTSTNDSSSQLCKFHYHGYCRRKNNCLNHHLELTCLDGPSCQDNYCRKVKRHPNYCRYFSASGSCKLDKKCSYTHTSFASEISNLKSQLDDLKDWIQQNIKQNISKPKSQVPGPWSLSLVPGHHVPAIETGRESRFRWINTTTIEISIWSFLWKP